VDTERLRLHLGELEKEYRAPGRVGKRVEKAFNHAVRAPGEYERAYKGYEQA